MNSAARTALTRLAGIVGAGRLITEPAQLAGCAIDGLEPSAIARPAAAEEVAEVVRFAAAEGLAVVPVAGRTALQMGAPPARYDLAIDLTGLNRVLAYDPGDLTLSVEAGTSLAAAQRVLAEKHQFLPLAPPFYGQATLGGILATNFSGPLRQAYGTARDFVLGMEFVTGEGTRAKSGGRVVKNVAGYDLHKLMIGALGTLGIVTSVNFKTFPSPRATGTWVASFARAEQALGMRRAISQSPLAPHALEIISPRMASLLHPEHRHLHPGAWTLATNTGGNPGVVERHARELERMAAEAGAESFGALGGSEESLLWERIREFPEHVMRSSPAATIARISLPPSEFAKLLDTADRIETQYRLPLAALVRSAGVVYLALLPPDRDPETLTRLAGACADLLHSEPDAGRAVLEWCPTEVKREVHVWGTPRGDFALFQRLKKVFDPQGILSPGRYVGGI